MSETILNLYSQLYSIDKEMIKLRDKKQRYFLDNVDESNKVGSIDIPLVLKGNVSDYERMREEVKNIRIQIDDNQKYIDNPGFYFKGIITDMKISGMKQEDIENRINHIENVHRRNVSYLENRLNAINESQKLFLRICECQNCDYSKIDSKEVKSKLKDMDKCIKKYENQRKNIQASINKIIAAYESLDGKDTNSLKLRPSKK